MTIRCVEVYSKIQQRRMRKILILGALLSIAFCSLQAQGTYEISYDYDEAGNRLRRRLIPVPIAKPTAENKKKSSPIEESWGERKITVYPNPTKGNLSINVEEADNEKNYQYYLYSSTGQLLMQGDFQNNGRHAIPLDGYKPGVYYLNLYDKDKKLNFKILKQ